MQNRDGVKTMGRVTAIGIQNFEEVIQKNCFYVDKTAFIKEWWEREDSVTLLTRPRRFGKTLNLSMMNYFFSLKTMGNVDGRENGKLFEGLDIWKEEKYRRLQGTYPVISLSFANVKEKGYASAKERICQLITELYIQNHYLREQEWMTEADRDFFDSVNTQMPEVVASMAIHKLCNYLYRSYGKKVIVLLDEYDTPMQEAYVDGHWKEMAGFTRSLFNATFKTNPWLERALMTGITRVGKESIFSDLNNLKVVTTTSEEYSTAFGFTEKEVLKALEEFGLLEEAPRVKRWYDGFIFGKVKDIYNPWSILNFLDTGKYQPYWANTSSNSLVGKLLQEGNRQIKEKFEHLLKRESIKAKIDEQIPYNELKDNETAVFSLLLASGYLKVLNGESVLISEDGKEPLYELALTNYEVERTFDNLVKSWFHSVEADYNDFVKALLIGDKKAMNAYMNRVALRTFSYFDTGNRPSEEEPERFYHGFVLGLIVELQERYYITSNRESGFGRYDVVLEPKDIKADDAMILEFKVRDPQEEANLTDTVKEALKQIKEKKYAEALKEKNIPQEHIRCYGFAFQGKKVLIG